MSYTVHIEQKNKKLYGKIIRLIHILIIIIIIYGSIFSNNKNIINLSFIFLISVITHWMLNDDTCILTILEKKITGNTDNKKSFIYSVVSPIYKIENNKLNKFIKLAAMSLLVISGIKLFIYF